MPSVYEILTQYANIFLRTCCTVSVDHFKMLYNAKTALFLHLVGIENLGLNQKFCICDFKICRCKETVNTRLHSVESSWPHARCM